MDDRFVSLATWVRAGASAAVVVPPVQNAPAVSPAVVDFAHADVVHELALLRIAAAEAFEAAARRLLRALAEDVLARELAVAPADLEALLAAVVARFGALEPLELAVSPLDAPRLRTPLPVRVDAQLGAGDLVVAVREGTLESSFLFRLESALERAAHA